MIKAINDLSRHTSPLFDEIERAVSRVIRSGYYVLGPEVTGFEREFADYCKASHCISVANGTDALELALRALHVGRGDKVITVANAGMYSTTAILANGATPVYAEIKPDTALIDTADVARLIQQHAIRAIVVTHLYGLAADIRAIVDIAKEKNIPVIEDCAQAHGAAVEGKKVGTFGDIGCFSFYPTKNLGALGDGGAVVTNNSELAGRVQQLRQYGWQSKYHTTLEGGRNSRLDEMQAAILRVKLPFLDGWNARRRAIAARYSAGIVHKAVTAPAQHGEEYVAHLYVVRTAGRDRLKEHLAAGNIPSDVHYPLPDYRQQPLAEAYATFKNPVTERHCAEALTLPCFPELSDAEVDDVIARVNSWQA